MLHGLGGQAKVEGWTGHKVTGLAMLRRLLAKAWLK